MCNGVCLSWCQSRILQSLLQLRNKSLFNGCHKTLYTGPWNERVTEFSVIWYVHLVSHCMASVSLKKLFIVRAGTFVNITFFCTSKITMKNKRSYFLNTNQLKSFSYILVSDSQKANPMPGAWWEMYASCST